MVVYPQQKFVVTDCAQRCISVVVAYNHHAVVCTEYHTQY